MAYQSLQASPIDADWNVLSAGTPFGVVTRRPDRPCLYSWYTIAASLPPFESGLALDSVFAGNRYIGIVGECPSDGVSMLALSAWSWSGIPPAVFAPSSIWPSTWSFPRPWWVEFTSSKLPAASLKPIGSASRWSWKLLR